MVLFDWLLVWYFIISAVCAAGMGDHTPAVRGTSVVLNLGLCFLLLQTHGVF